MSKNIFSATLIGVESKLVQVEIDHHFGLSHFSIVGLADRSIQEAKERVIPAIRNSGMEFTPQRTVINLSPSHIHKQGTHFDLAIAIAYLQATRQIEVLHPTLFLGELSLTGKLNSTRGILPMCLASRADNMEVIVPLASIKHLGDLAGLNIKGFDCLEDMIGYLKGDKVRFQTPVALEQKSNPEGPNLDDIRGQNKAKRALQIALAGKHNLLLIGPPGCGKTMLANTIPSLLPRLPLADRIEVGSIWNLVQGVPDVPLPSSPPFVAPHHSASLISLVGGGSSPLPGAISLAHKGILFLDELAEFPRQVINSLRQPLESKQITVSRANYSVNFPADFQLIAAMNLCPCGKTGTRYDCECTQTQKLGYFTKISHPIIDRFAMIVRLAPEESHSRVVLTHKEVAESLERKLTLPEKTYSSEVEELLLSLKQEHQFSYRELTHVKKVALTISVLEQRDLSVNHVLEALNFRDKFST